MRKGLVLSTQKKWNCAMSTCRIHCGRSTLLTGNDLVQFQLNTANFRPRIFVNTGLYRNLSGHFEGNRFFYCNYSFRFRFSLLSMKLSSSAQSNLSSDRKSGSKNSLLQMTNVFTKHMKALNFRGLYCIYFPLRSKNNGCKTSSQCSRSTKSKRKCIF